MTGNLSRTKTKQIGALALLGTHEPDRARDARIRARCHSALEKRRRAGTPRRPAWRLVAEPAIIGTLGAVYLLDVLSRAVQLYPF